MLDFETFKAVSDIVLYSLIMFGIGYAIGYRRRK